MASILNGWNYIDGYAKTWHPHQNPIANVDMGSPTDKQLNMIFERDDEPMNEPVEEYKHCGYMSQALRRKEIDQSVEICLAVLEKKQFDTIAFRGMSGALIAPIVAHWLQKEVIMIRKKTTELTHSNHLVEGYIAAKKYVILDDFIQGGGTVREIVSRVKEFTSVAEIVGGVFYAQENTPWYTAKALKERTCDY